VRTIRGRANPRFWRQIRECSELRTLGAPWGDKLERLWSTGRARQSPQQLSLQPPFGEGNVPAVGTVRCQRVGG